MKKDKTNLKMIVAIIVAVIISSGITAFATIQVQANQIGYNTTTVADALDSMYNTMFSDNYSTNERVVGKWIDGKPVYQRVIKKTNSTTLSANTWGTIYTDDFISEISQLTSVTYINTTNKGVYSALNYKAVNNNLQALYYSGLSIASDTYFVMQYTKTTDQVENN